jgi:hypothetical protein
MAKEGFYENWNPQGNTPDLAFDLYWVDVDVRLPVRSGTRHGVGWIGWVIGWRLSP